MSNKDDSFEHGSDKEHRIDFEKLRRISAFVDHLQQMHYMHQAELRKEWRERRNEYLMQLDMVDNVVEMMDEYPEAENIINKILRRIDNDKKY